MQQFGDDKKGAKMPKRRRGELDGRRRLYLVLDDWVWGYSIREIDLSSPFAGDERRRRRRLPPPLIQLEAPHGSPWLFAGVGGKILAMHSRMDYGDSVPGGFVSIVDVRTRGVTFGPCHVYLCSPIFFSVADDDELYALEYGLGLVKLSLKPLWPPRLEYENNLHHAGGDDKWAWLTLAAPPFDTMDVRSCALHPDGKTILVCATAPEFNNPFRRNNDGDDGAAAAGGTFGFDTKGEQVWVRHGEWTMPFVGWAHFVHGLNALVGFSDDPDTAGHLCACEVAAVAGGGDRRRPSWKVGKEKMVGEDPNERQIGYTLVYMGGAGEGSESGDEGFCLVECVTIGDEEELEEEDGVMSQRRRRPTVCWYRLTTFSLSYDSNGDVTTGGTRRVRWYKHKVPREIGTKGSSVLGPEAFWL